MSALPVSQETPVLNLPDNEVVGLTTVQMAPHQGTRLSELLAVHSEEQLNPTEHRSCMRNVGKKLKLKSKFMMVDKESTDKIMHEIPL